MELRDGVWTSKKRADDLREIREAAETILRVSSQVQVREAAARIVRLARDIERDI